MRDGSSQEDISSPRLQRRLWRRVWIGLAVFILVVPVLMWIAVDQGGKREWQRVQAELRAKGEATTIAELNLPKSGDIPDQENFGAVKWLRANEDGLESPAIAEMLKKLEVFSYYARNTYARRWADGNAFIGLKSDFETMAQLLEDAMAGMEIRPRDRPFSKNDDARSKILGCLKMHDVMWNDLLKAKERPHAQVLPLISERIAAAEFPIAVTTETQSRMSFAKALRWRALLALHDGDIETFLNAQELGTRLVNLSLNEQSLIGSLVANSIANMMHQPTIELLWEALADDALGEGDLLRLQNAWEGFEFEHSLHSAMRSEFVLTAQTWMLLPRHRSAARDGFYTGDLQSFVLQVAPSGWFHNSAAYGGELFERYLFSHIRSHAHPGKLIEASQDMLNEIKRLNQIERVNYFPVVMSIPVYGNFVLRIAHSEACRRQIIIACALHRHRKDNAGAFPDTLEKLVPTYLDAVPQDPIDGNPMRYAFTGESGGFKLWSIGHDGVDDGCSLNLDTEKPDDTGLYRDTYLGDWPWPTAPRKFDRPDSASE